LNDKDAGEFLKVQEEKVLEEFEKQIDDEDVVNKEARELSKGLMED